MIFPVDNMIFSGHFKTQLFNVLILSDIKVILQQCDIWCTVRSRKNLATLIKGQSLLCGKKTDLFLEVNDALISSGSCSYSFIRYYFYHNILWFILALISWVHMGKKESSWLGTMTLADNIASAMSAVVWIKQVFLLFG